MTGKSVSKAIDEYMDWLSDQPESYIRRMFANKRIPHNVDFSWEIGGTEYIVTSHFNQNAGEDIFNKLTHILENEIAE
jgi:hypothetical protein